jgi:endoglucanase
MAGGRSWTSSAVALAAGLMLALAAPARADPVDWARFKAAFVAESGRVVDTDNGRVSHSEGQGWGLLFAEAYGDRAVFERILAWTERHLAVREDRLYAWRWHPDRPDGPVPDRNNASDGDLYIAWALLRAAERWQQPDWRDRATAILADLADCCLIEYGGRLILLPGADGFVRDDHAVVNLSYWIFPALPAAAEATGDPRWRDLAASGQELLRDARFGRWDLPADWTRLAPDGTVALAPGFAPRFSWDAIRVPLLLAWGGRSDADLYAPFVRWQSDTADYPAPPAWTNLDDDSVASYARNPGVAAALLLAQRRHALALDAPPPDFAVAAPAAAQGYYAASLLLLARLAAAAEQAR